MIVETVNMEPTNQLLRELKASAELLQQTTDNLVGWVMLIFLIVSICGGFFMGYYLGKR